MLHEESGIRCSLKRANDRVALREHSQTVAELDSARLSCFVATPEEEHGSESLIYWEVTKPRYRDMIVYFTLVRLFRLKGAASC